MDMELQGSEFTMICFSLALIILHYYPKLPVWNGNVHPVPLCIEMLSQ